MPLDLVDAQTSLADTTTADGDRPPTKTRRPDAAPAPPPVVPVAPVAKFGTAPASNVTLSTISAERRAKERQAARIAYLEMCLRSSHNDRGVTTSIDNAHKKMLDREVALVPAAYGVTKALCDVMEWADKNQAFDCVFQLPHHPDDKVNVGDGKRSQLTYDEDWRKSHPCRRQKAPLAWLREGELDRLRKLIGQLGLKHGAYHLSPTVLRSLPGCTPQAFHCDVDCEGAFNGWDEPPFNIIVAVDDRETFLDVFLAGSADPVRVMMRQGDVLLFRGDTKHRGSEHRCGRQTPHFRLHCYVDPTSYDRPHNRTKIDHTHTCWEP